MIFSYKALTTVVSLLIVLNFNVINGQNRYQKSVGPKLRSKTQSLSQQRDYVIKNSPQSVAETKAQHSVLSAGKDLTPAAGHHGGGGGGGGGGHGYYQYARVPHKGAWEFGYKRGNPHHHREQHEQGKGHQFKTKLKWSDKHGGHGEHYWDYNHAGKHKGYGKGHGGGGFGGGRG